MRVTLKIELKQYSSSLPIRAQLRLVPHQTSEQLTEKMAGQVSSSTTEAERTISELTTKLEQYRQGKLEHLKPKKRKKSDNSLSRKKKANTVSKRPKTDDQHPC
ncbi:MAG: hypothetical protein IPO37_25515 [Saprospiraceae bacterium]|nr:hypothetical protein [Saprospiraceae bacterium]